MKMRLYMAVRIAVPATMTLMQPMIMVAVNIQKAAVTAMETQLVITATVITM
jgi:hypothetical protein